MIGQILNIVIGVGLIFLGNMILNESQITKSFMDRLQKITDSFMGGKFCIPFYVVGILFTLAGLFALFVAFMLFAQDRGFWIV